MQNLGSFELLVGFPCINLLSNHVRSPYLSLRPQGGQRSYPRGFAWSYISLQQECTEVQSRWSSVGNCFRNRNGSPKAGGPMLVAASGTGTSAPSPPKTGGPMSVAASGTGTSLPTPPKPERSSTLPLSSHDPGAGSSTGSSRYGTRPKGRPTYVPQ